MKYNFFKENKYKNTKIKIGNEKFDSKKEYNRYIELCEMQKNGEIKDLKRQVKFILVPSQKNIDGKVIELPITYIADFVYLDKNLFMVVEDTKGHKTKDYIIKRKLMLYLRKIKIREI